MFEVSSGSCFGSTITQFAVSAVDKRTSKVSSLQSKLNYPKKSN